MVVLSLTWSHLTWAIDPSDTLLGTNAGASITGATDDTALGNVALYNTTVGSQNTAVGSEAL